MTTALGERATLVHRARIAAIRDTGAVLVLRRWQYVDIDNPNSVRYFAAQGTAIVSQGQRQAIASAAVYLGAFIAAERDIAPPTIDIDGDALVGRTLAGRQIGEVMTRAAIYARVQRNLGNSLPRARQAAALLLVRRVRTELVDTSRSALLDGMTNADVTTYTVVTSLGRCEWCAAIAASGPRATNTRPRFHDHCRCTLQPNLERQRGRRRDATPATSSTA